MPSRLSHLWVFIAAVLAMLLCGCSDSQRTPPMAINGVVDLSDWDFERDGTAKLRGEWRFIWNELVEPMPLDTFMERYTHKAVVRHQWPDVQHPAHPDQRLPDLGHATYGLEIKLPANTADLRLALTNKEITSAARWQILSADGHPLAAPLNQGTPGTSRAASIAYPEVMWSDLNGLSDTRVFLLVHLSNYSHARGGLHDPPEIGLYERVAGNWMAKHMLDGILFGIVLITALYHITLFVQHREDKASLAFALFCLSIAARQWVMARFSHALGIGNTTDGYELLLALEYITMPTLGLTSALFIAALVPSRFVKLFTLIWCGGLGAPLVAFCLLKDSLTVSQSIFAFHIHLIVAMFVILAHLGFHAYKQNSYARLALLAFTLLVIGGVNDVLKAQGYVEGPFMAPYAFIAFVLMQSGILSGKLAWALHRVEALSLNLQNEVDIQTQSLRDTSERELRHAKNLLTQSDKLAQLGGMVACIGHEIANPIMLVTMSTDHVKMSIDKIEKNLMPLFTGSEEAEKLGKTYQEQFDGLRTANEQAHIGSNRLKELSLALRTQSRMELEATPNVDINEVIKESLTLAGGRTKRHTLTESLGELPTVLCFRSKVGQVVTNLVANAADALTEKSERQLEKGGERFSGQISVMSLATPRGDQQGVSIIISDNGDGVPEAIHEKIFDQFFTTKPAGVGTGLGLSMCMEIVKEHQGILSVSRDETLGGARFELWLPLEVELNNTESS